ncbi:hypothetical protein B0H11DRAFT_1903464 [Mycena galericulata]|nr:hypothetical protein B0H11DRAFT_1903464 [Mycena galericulata]
MWHVLLIVGSLSESLSSWVLLYELLRSRDLDLDLIGFGAGLLLRMRREGAGTAGQRRRDDELALRWTGPDSPSNPNPIKSKSKSRLRSNSMRYNKAPCPHVGGRNRDLSTLQGHWRVVDDITQEHSAQKPCSSRRKPSMTAVAGTCLTNSAAETGPPTRRRSRVREFVVKRSQQGDILENHGKVGERAKNTQLRNFKRRAVCGGVGIARCPATHKAMKEVGTSRLEEFRFLIWSEASDRDFGLTPLAEFLPDIMIKIILDNFVRYKTTGDLTEVVKNLAGMVGRHEQLHGVIEELQVTFARMREETTATKAAAAAA